MGLLPAFFGPAPAPPEVPQPLASATFLCQPKPSSIWQFGRTNHDGGLRFSKIAILYE